MSALRGRRRQSAGALLRTTKSWNGLGLPCGLSSEDDAAEESEPPAKAPRREPEEDTGELTDEMRAVIEASRQAALLPSAARGQPPASEQPAPEASQKESQEELRDSLHELPAPGAAQEDSKEEPKEGSAPMDVYQA